MRSWVALGLAALAVSACRKDYPYHPQAYRYAESYQRCRLDAPMDDQVRSDCFIAAEWLAFQGHTDEALAYHRALCAADEVRSCRAVLDRTDDAAAAWRLCADDVTPQLGHCARGFAAVPAHDPRRAALMHKHCATLTSDCVWLMGLQLAEDPASWARAAATLGSRCDTCGRVSGARSSVARSPRGAPPGPRPGPGTPTRRRRHSSSRAGRAARGGRGARTR